MLLLLAILLMYYVLRKFLVEPLKKMEGVVNGFPKDFDVEIPEELREREDEIGMVVNAFSDLRRKVLTYQEIAHVTEYIFQAFIRSDEPED